MGAVTFFFFCFTVPAFPTTADYWRADTSFPFLDVFRFPLLLMALIPFLPVMAVTLLFIAPNLFGLCVLCFEGTTRVVGYLRTFTPVALLCPPSFQGWRWLTSFGSPYSGLLPVVVSRLFYVADSDFFCHSRRSPVINCMIRPRPRYNFPTVRHYVVIHLDYAQFRRVPRFFLIYFFSPGDYPSILFWVLFLAYFMALENLSPFSRRCFFMF